MMKPLLLDMVISSYIAFSVVTCGLHITNTLVVCVFQNKNSCISSLDLHYLSRGIYPYLTITTTIVDNGLVIVKRDSC